MRFVSEPRCPSDRCLKSFRMQGPIPLITLFRELPRESWPAWFAEIIAYKEAVPEHLTDAVYECPYCHLVWIQPSNFDAGFRAMPRGYRRSDPDRLEPVPAGVRIREPEGHMVAEARGKRRR